MILIAIVQICCHKYRGAYFEWWGSALCRLLLSKPIQNLFDRLENLLDRLPSLTNWSLTNWSEDREEEMGGRWSKPAEPAREWDGGWDSIATSAESSTGQKILCFRQKREKPWKKLYVDEKKGYCDWMKECEDIRICDLPLLLCTHNSGCSSAHTGWNPVWYWAWTQKMSIRDQLHWGVRLFDVRLCDDNSSDFGEIYVAHTLVTNLRFKTMLDHFKEFLDANPSEVIFCWIRKDYRRILVNREEIAQTVNYSEIEVAECDHEKMFAQTVGELAGKMVLICGEDMFHSHEVHWKEIDDPDLRASMRFPEIGIMPNTWPQSPLQCNICDIWRLGSVYEAKDAIWYHCQECHREKADGHTICGLAIDGTYNPPPPYFLSPKINEWFFGLLSADEWPNVNGWMGVCELDMLSPESASFMMNFYYGPHSEFRKHREKFSAASVEKMKESKSNEKIADSSSTEPSNGVTDKENPPMVSRMASCKSDHTALKASS